ncbi:MAG: NfeD family protein [Peptoniphilaceae bacterium]|nr:NfeD family protein [Peptoniphilaceae bacterium]MDY6085168.1 NfeD family protein [Peptoniphilaceae bacterium]
MSGYINPLIISALPVLAVVLFVAQLYMPRRGLFGVLGLILMIGYGAFSLATGSGDVLALVILVMGLVAGFFELASPGFGLFGVTGIACLIAGILLAAQSTGQGISTVGAMLVAAVVAVALFRATGHHVTWLHDQILWTQNGSAEGFRTRENPSDALRGKVGVALTNLRPAGLVDIDGARLDALSRGEFIAQGTPIEVIQTANGTLTVRARAAQLEEA